jgi:hypothetical protein
MNRIIGVICPLFPPRVFAKCLPIRRMIGRCGGDRKLAYSNKPHCFMALQPPFQNNRYN